MFQANCYICAPDGKTAYLIDVGMDAADTARQAVADAGLEVAAVIATHGHIDHTAEAAELADEYAVPLWIHSADRMMLSDPGSWLNPLAAAQTVPMLKRPMVEPERLLFYDQDAELAKGLPFAWTHAPGHSPGSVLLAMPYGGEGFSHIVFTGDVVFAGSVGRTDIPGGDKDVMRATLDGPVRELPAESVLLPGHGPQTTLARELAANPYLRR
ncbi:MAG: MBL fold metallo-hydrolase [Propionibacteriaceae bacterium]|nr:MBL fold metallo-hydrolase [Propionibacteriaceae bacterium]